MFGGHYGTATRMITKDDITAARARIRQYVVVTPVVTSPFLDDATGTRLGLKCESLQRTGSFKARGALNAMMQLDAAERQRGVVTVSAGNHAQALAWASRLVNAECIAVMHEKASPAKIRATEGYGGRVELVSGERQRAFDRAEEIAAQGRIMVHPFEDDRVAAGQGTVGLEIGEQMSDVDVVVVPVGGGGLIAGMTVALKSIRPQVKVYGVEPVGAATMRNSLDAGAPQKILPNTVADGLAAPVVGAMTLDVVRRFVEDVVLVTDEEIIVALREIVTHAKLLVEPAGAAGVAALLASKIPLPPNARVAVVLSGGNVDLDRLKTLL
jgi:threonine dehydratase